MNIKNNVIELIGNTPILKLNKIKEKYNLKSNLFLKMECFNPGFSIKDRVALNMIQDVLNKKIITENGTIIEATSGNTGIGLSLICNYLNLKLIIVMPENMSEERKKIFNILGTKVILTSKEGGMNESIKMAEKIQKITKDSIYLSQFDNYSNVVAHYKTGEEIINDMDGNIDYFICGVGTGGTLTGIGKILKEKINDVSIIAVEPENSAVLSGKKSGIHKIQGIGAGFVPTILDTKIYDDIVTINCEDAIKMVKVISKLEGIMVGISTAANICACIKYDSLIRKDNKNILTIAHDLLERYLSAY